MSSVSESLTWCIRWETVERQDGVPLYGALLPDTFETRRGADRERRRLMRTHPRRYSPFQGGTPKEVKYVVFTRREDDDHAL